MSGLQMKSERDQGQTEGSWELETTVYFIPSPQCSLLYARL